MDNTFYDDEKLYRRVPSQPSFWKENNTLSSAAFKDSHGGVSVDRAGGRNNEECVDTIHVKFPEHSIVSVAVNNCRECDSIVKYLPVKGQNDTEDNIYHSEIHKNETEFKLTKKQSQYLTNAATIELKK